MRLAWEQIRAASLFIVPCLFIVREQTAELVDRLTRECTKRSTGGQTKRVGRLEGEIDVST
jgi:hypothetical protein